jgi:uncharacterized membrane protein YeaQ/YmgE (transglycosylase-associated protein family)
MIEIIILVFLARRIGKIAEKKGHKKRPNIIFFVVMWIAGEIIGAMLGAFLAKGQIYTTYALALIGAAVGAMIAFRIVKNLDDRSDPNMITIDGD